MAVDGSGTPASWDDLEPAWRRCLALAYASLRAGGLAVGSVLTDAAGAVVASGRNRAYDPPGGTDPLQGTPLAHAEMNALGAARTGWDLSDHTLWSTQRPCAMCTTAAEFTGVGRIRFLAPDPWALATGVPGTPGRLVTGPGADLWLVAANVLFLHSVATRAGLAHPTVTGNLAREPETAAIAVDLVESGGTAVRDNESVADFLDAVWEPLTAAAAARSRRMSTG